MRRKGIATEALIDLRRRLEVLAPRSHERRRLLQQAAVLYGVSEVTLYRALRVQGRPRALQRSDYGTPRKLLKEELEFYCELIAALKLRTCNRKGRHLSTVRAIEILENYGLETPRGFVKPKPDMLKKTTINRYLKQWGYDHVTLTRPPPAVRFEACHSNDCWHFDLSPSDLKHIKRPLWVKEGRGQPLLMLYSVVDDCSGMCYQEYRCVYGEDVEAALRPFKSAGNRSRQRSLSLCSAKISMRARLVFNYCGPEISLVFSPGRGCYRSASATRGRIEKVPESEGTDARLG